MSLLESLSDGLRSLFRKEQINKELDEELNGFLEMAAEEKMKQGMSRKDALRAVRLERYGAASRPVGSHYFQLFARNRRRATWNFQHFWLGHRFVQIC